MFRLRRGPKAPDSSNTAGFYKWNQVIYGAFPTCVAARGKECGPGSTAVTAERPDERGDHHALLTLNLTHRRL